MQTRTYHSLDGLRGIAALAVVFWHLDWLVAPLRPQHGDLAVDLFFIMSGFVIAHAYEARLQKGLSSWRFVVLRMIRLYPLYLLGTLMGVWVALMGVGEAFDWSTVALSLAMLPTPSFAKGSLLYPYDNVAWSLLLEVVINVVYAFTWRRWTQRALVAMIAASAVLLVLATLIHGDANFGWTWRKLPGGVARVFFGFPMGVLLYRLASAGRLEIRSRFSPVIAATLLLLAWRPERFGIAVDLVGLLIAAPLAVALATRCEPPSWALRPAAALGAASYGVYAIHLPCIALLKAMIDNDRLQALAPWGGLVFAAGVFLLAIIIDAIYDAPVRRRLTQWVVERAAKADQAPLGATVRAPPAR
jgi:peptidoglycan/LPS O-acetylase OafA/YrhL